MSSLVARAATIAAGILARRRRVVVTPLYPDICGGIADLTGELHDAAVHLVDLATLLVAARATRNIVAVEWAQGAIARKLADLSRRNDSIGWVLARHARQGGFICCENDPGCREPCGSHPWRARR
jgi:hypothetical protein